MLVYRRLENRYDIDTEIISFKTYPKLRIRTDLVAVDIDIISNEMFQYMQSDTAGLHDIRD
jgi:hypothetical protein